MGTPDDRPRPASEFLPIFLHGENNADKDEAHEGPTYTIVQEPTEAWSTPRLERFAAMVERCIKAGDEPTLLEYPLARARRLRGERANGEGAEDSQRSPKVAVK